MNNNFFTRPLISMFLMSSLTHLSVVANEIRNEELLREQWLKERFSEQHERLIPVVAVADMYFGCQQSNNDGTKLTIKSLIVTLDKNQLAEKLISCLGENSPKSDVALNYGLLGCFHEQLADLSENEKTQKMKLVKNAIASLSREERQKSFTQCVTDQAISYLK